MNTTDKTIERLIKQLETCPDPQLDIIPQAKTYFLPNMQRTYDLYQELAGFGKKEGQATYAKFFLMGRSINDLLSGFYLATQGYIIQSHTVIRPILESIDLIKLFRKNPREAELWINGGKSAWNQLKPSEVRKKLGDDSFDLIYSHFCENGTHPSFEGAKNMTAMQIGNEKPNLTLWIGGIHNDYAKPRLMLLFGLIFFIQLTLLVLILQMNNQIEPDKSSRIILESINNFQTFSNYVGKELKINNEDNFQEISKIIENLKKSVINY